MRVQVKVLEVMDPTTVASGKKVQDVTVADSTDCARCTLWETDIGQRIISTGLPQPGLARSAHRLQYL